MLILWRISRIEHSAFDGEGSRHASGRWHHRGARIIYTSEHLSLAALEFFVNIGTATEGSVLAAASVEIPDDLTLERYRISDLPRSWRAVPYPRDLQDLGMEWLTESASAILAVPSAVIPRENNYLLNPLHPDFVRIRVRRPERFSLDRKSVV